MIFFLYRMTSSIFLEKDIFFMVYSWLISQQSNITCIKQHIGTIVDIFQEFYSIPFNLWVSLHFSLSYSCSPLLCRILKTLHITQVSSSAVTSLFYLFSFHLNVSVWSFSLLPKIKSPKNQSSESCIALLSSWPTNIVANISSSSFLHPLLSWISCFFPV